MLAYVCIAIAFALVAVGGIVVLAGVGMKDGDT